MEKMTKKERETLLALQAKAKRVQRAEEEFFRDADERKEELLARWGMLDIVALMNNRGDGQDVSSEMRDTSSTSLRYDQSDEV